MPSIYEDLGRPLPLPAGQIRMLKIQSISPDIVCLLEVHELAAIKDSYFALSYEWGTQPNEADLVEIKLNDREFHIWPNLAAALRELYPHLLEPRDQQMVWTDAICLDQGSRPEKVIQVPLMGQIYHSARMVIGYLGPNIDHPRAGESETGTSFGDQAIVQIKSICDQYHAIEGGVPDVDLQRIFDIPGERFSHPTSIYRFLGRTYFKRVWIWQEAVLAKELFFICGGTSLEWWHLNMFIQIVMRHQLSHLVLNGGGRTKIHSNLYQLAMLEQHRHNYHHDGYVSEHLFVILDFFRGLEVGRYQVDRIWGSLALWRPDTAGVVLQDTVGVDYDSHYSITYIRLARIILPNDIYMAFLTFAATPDKHPALPSWCPDWNTRQSNYYFISFQGCQAGFGPNEKRRSSVILLPDRDLISVNGCFVDIVHEVAEGQFPENAGYDEQARAVAQQWCRWEQNCLDISMRAYNTGGNVPRQHWRTLIADVVVSGEVIDSSTDLSEDYRKLKSHMARRCDGLFASSVERKAYRSLAIFHSAMRVASPVEKQAWASLNAFYAAIRFACQGRRFFSTRGKQTGLGPPFIKTGDFVVAIDSAAPLFIVRNTQSSLPQVSQPIQWKLLGEAWVCDRMLKRQVAQHKIVEYGRFVLA